MQLQWEHHPGVLPWLQVQPAAPLHRFLPLLSQKPQNVDLHPTHIVTLQRFFVASLRVLAASTNIPA